MTDANPRILDIAARLEALTDELKRATVAEDRRALLKQFRVLLDQADQYAASGTFEAPPPSEAGS